MSKQESRLPVQVVGVHGGESVEGLYVLASDGSIWKLSEFKDLAYWQQLDPLPGDEAPEPPLPRDEVARHRLLCDALRQLEIGGANIAELTTAEVVAACRSAVPDADSDEILMALRAVGRPV